MTSSPLVANDKSGGQDLRPSDASDIKVGHSSKTRVGPKAAYTIGMYSI
jgi:hypothetical protein